MSTFSLIVIIILFPKLSDSGYHPQYYPDFGVLVEPNGVVISYDEVTYVTVIHEFRTEISTKIIPKCEVEMVNQFTTITLKNNMDILFGMVPSSSEDFIEKYCELHHGLCIDQPRNIYPRNKRQIIPIMALLSGVGGIVSSAYSWIKTNELSEHLDRVRKHLSKVEADQIIHDSKENQLIKTSNDVIHQLSKSTANFNNFLRSYKCHQSEMADYLMYKTSADSIREEQMGLMEMMKGYPDSRIINGRVLDEILRANHDLSDSIFNKEKSLFYQTVKSNLIYSDRNNLTFGFLLEIPLIKQTMISPLYMVYNGGWMIDSIVHKLKLPEDFYLYSIPGDVDFHAVSTNPNTCWKRFELTICDNSKHLITEEMICLNAIIRNESTTSCDTLLTKMMGEKSVIKANSGVLIVGNYDLQTIKTIGPSFNYISNILKNDAYTKFIPYYEFKQLIIDKIIIRSNKHHLKVVVRDNSSLHIPNIDYSWVDNYLMTNPWATMKEIEQIKESDKFFTESYLTTGTHRYGFWILLCMLVIIILLLTTSYLLCRRVRLMRTQVENLNLYKNLSMKRLMS